MFSKKPKIPYGVLNPIQEEKFKAKIPTRPENVFKYFRETVVKTLFENNLDIKGVFTGFVLNVEKSDRTAISDMDRFFNFFGNVSPKISMATVRVPEINSDVPEFENMQDPLFLELHHKFEFFPDEIGGLEPGNIVRVTFYDNDGVHNPRIIEKVKDQTIDLKTFNITNIPQTFLQASSGFSTDFNQDVENAYVDVVNNWTPDKTKVTLKQATMYEENRVRVNKVFQPIPSNSQLLVGVPSRPGYNARCHTLVAKRFVAMREALMQQTGYDLRVQSGWRKVKYKNYEEFIKDLESKYVYNNNKSISIENLRKEEQYKYLSQQQLYDISIKEAKKRLGYKGGHTLAMAVDLYWDGRPHGEMVFDSSDSDKNSELEETSLFKWLKQNAHLYGFTPYKNEAWHWECLLPINSWLTGEEFTSNYSVRVVETSIKKPSSRSNSSYFAV